MSRGILRPPTAAALLAVAGLAATLWPRDGDPALAWAALPLAVSLALFVIFPRRLGVRRDDWAPWVVLVGLGAVVARLGGPGAGPGQALLLAAVAAAAVTLTPWRSLAPVAAAALHALRSGVPATSEAGGLGTSGFLFAVVGAWGAVSFAAERLRAARPGRGAAAGRGAEGPAAGAGRGGVDASGPADDAATGRPTGGEAGESRVGDAGESRVGDAELAGLLEVGRRSLRARSCVLFERRLEPPGWSLVAGTSVAPDFDGRATAPLGHGLVAWAARHGVPLRLSEPSPQLRALPWLGGGGEAGSFLAVALAAGPSGRPAAGDGSGAWAVLAAEAPGPRRFGDEAEGLLALLGERLESRMALALEAGAQRDALERTRSLAPAAAAVVEADSASGAASVLLSEALRLTGAGAGAVLRVASAAGPGPGGGGALPGAPGEPVPGRRATLLAARGLTVPSGHVLDPDEESWSTWCAAHPDQPVRLGAFGPDRGLPRVARRDGLAAAWSFAAWPLVDAGGLAGGSLGLAWPQRQLPAESLLGSVAALAAVGAATLERELGRERLQQGRRHDALTGLPTRSAFLRRAEELFEEAAAGGGRLAVALFDLEGSGSLLAEAGPEAWDEAVETAARGLVAALPPQAEAFRWGGDELAALLPRTTAEGALVAARRCVAAVGKASVAGRPLLLSAGLAVLSADDARLPSLLERARVALDQARAAGGGKTVSG